MNKTHMDKLVAFKHPSGYNAEAVNTKIGSSSVNPLQIKMMVAHRGMKTKFFMTLSQSFLRPLCLSVTLSTVFNLQCAVALEPGFYDSKTNEAECDEISAFSKDSKRLVLDRDLRMTINNNGWPSESRTWSETFAVLQKEDAHKKKLSIYFRNPYGVLIPKPTLATYVAGCNERVLEMKPGLDKLGYQQIMIFTTDPNYINPFKGYYLLAHFKYPQKNSSESSSH